MNILLGIISAFVLTLHSVATYFNWYKPTNNLDDFMHFLAGFWIGLVVIKLIQQYRLFSLNNVFWINCLLIMSLTLTIGVFWEFFEFSADWYTRYFYNKSVLPATVSDTLGDLLFDFIGAFPAVAIFFAVKKEK